MVDGFAMHSLKVKQDLASEIVSEPFQFIRRITQLWVIKRDNHI